MTNTILNEFPRHPSTTSKGQPPAHNPFKEATPPKSAETSIEARKRALAKEFKELYDTNELTGDRFLLGLRILQELNAQDNATTQTQTSQANQVSLEIGATQQTAIEHDAKPQIFDVRRYLQLLTLINQMVAKDLPQKQAQANIDVVAYALAQIPAIQTLMKQKGNQYQALVDTSTTHTKKLQLIATLLIKDIFGNTFYREELARQELNAFIAHSQQFRKQIEQQLQELADENVPLPQAIRNLTHIYSKNLEELLRQYPNTSQVAQ